MARKLFLFDLDWTALGGDYAVYGRLPDVFCAFLDNLVANGWDWGINSAWDQPGQWKLCKESTVKTMPKFLIARCGELYAVNEDGPVSEEPYNREKQAMVKANASKTLLPLLHELFTECPPYEVSYLENRVFITFPENVDAWTLRGTRKFLTQGDYMVYGERANLLRIRPTSLTKGSPLYILNDKYGYAPENIVIAGDAFPDLFMMDVRHARHFIAPKNANPIVLAHVRQHGGVVGDYDCAVGIMDAFQKIRSKIK